MKIKLHYFLQRKKEKATKKKSFEETRIFLDELGEEAKKLNYVDFKQKFKIIYPRRGVPQYFLEYKGRRVWETNVMRGMEISSPKEFPSREHAKKWVHEFWTSKNLNN